MNSKKTLSFLFFLCFYSFIFAQDIRIGAPTDNRYNPSGGFYDYGDPRYVNIMVNIWGYVRFPGKFYVPENTKLIDLISYAGGPTPDAMLEDIRLFRNSSDGNSIQKFDFNELLYDEGPKVDLEQIPRLNAGDIVLLPGQPRLFFREWTSISLSVISTLISLTILILNIVK